MLFPILFPLKTLLHLRHNHNLPSWVVFTDLVKAFNTSYQKLLIAILARYGAPPRFCSAIRRMYENCVVRLIIGKIDTSIPFKVGVKQGDSMAPVLFLFLIMAFAETLEKEWKNNRLTKATFSRQSNSPPSTGHIFSHKPKSFNSRNIFELFCMLYVDDGAFVFEIRRDLEKGLLLIFTHFAKFGLKMHIGRGPKPSKTECVFFSPPGFFKPLSHSSPAVDIDSSQVTIPAKKDNEKKYIQREDKAYDKSNETNIITFSDVFVTFTKNFRYLGIFVSYNIHDDYDVDRRLASESS